MNVIIIFGVLLVVFGALIYAVVAFTPLKYYVIPDITDYKYRSQAHDAGLVARYIMIGQRCELAAFIRGEVEAFVVRRPFEAVDMKVLRRVETHDAGRGHAILAA